MCDTPELIFSIYKLPMENDSFFSKNFIISKTGENVSYFLLLQGSKVMSIKTDMTISWPQRTDFYGSMSEIKVSFPKKLYSCMIMLPTKTSEDQTNLTETSLSDF